MPVRNKGNLVVLDQRQKRKIRHDGEVEQHLIHFGITVAANTQGFNRKFVFNRVGDSQRDCTPSGSGLRGP